MDTCDSLERVTQRVNGVLALITDAAYAHGGDVTSFNGDAVTVLFAAAQQQGPQPPSRTPPPLNTASNGGGKAAEDEAAVAASVVQAVRFAQRTPVKPPPIADLNYCARACSRRKCNMSHECFGAAVCWMGHESSFPRALF